MVYVKFYCDASEYWPCDYTTLGNTINQSFSSVITYCIKALGINQEGVGALPRLTLL